MGGVGKIKSDRLTAIFLLYLLCYNTVNMTLSFESMDRPGSVPPPPSSERSSIETFRQKLLYDLIINKAERVTAGNNGIILRLSHEDLPEDQREEMKALGLDWDTDAAVKILKIFSPQMSKREFAIQKEAHRIIDAQSPAEDFAQVPTPLYHGHLSLDGDKRETLSEKADYDFKYEGCQIIAMDFVNGDDLATITNRETLKFLFEHLMKRKEMAPLIKSFEGTWESDDYNELQSSIEKLFDILRGFDYRMTGLPKDLMLRYPSEGATSAESLQRVYRANAKAKLDILKLAGFSFNPAVAKQIAKTVKLLKEKGIHMTDSHQRNFMVTGDVTGDGEAQAYVIDYGNTSCTGEMAIQYGENPPSDIGMAIEDTENILHWLGSIQTAASRRSAPKRWNEQ